VVTTDLKIAAVTDAYLQATITVRAEILGRSLFEIFSDSPADPRTDCVADLRALLQSVSGF
jgi:hypothetical protein